MNYEEELEYLRIQNAELIEELKETDEALMNCCDAYEELYNKHIKYKYTFLW